MSAANRKPHIRWMIRRDMTEVMQIIRNNGESISEDEILQLLRQRNNIGMVAEINEFVVGFMIYELKKQSINIIHLMVEPIHNRLGYGGALLNKLKEKLTGNRRSYLKFTLRESNLAGQLFLRKNKCFAIEIVRNYFEDNGEDAYLFEYEYQNKCITHKSPVIAS